MCYLPRDEMTSTFSSDGSRKQLFKKEYTQKWACISLSRRDEHSARCILFVGLFHHPWRSEWYQSSRAIQKAPVRSCVVKMCWWHHFYNVVEYQIVVNVASRGKILISQAKYWFSVKGWQLFLHVWCIAVQITGDSGLYCEVRPAYRYSTCYVMVSWI